MARKLLTGADLNNQRAVNLADPTAATDAVTKQYVDNAILGLSWKQPVRVATTTNGSLANAFANGQTIDGAVLVTGNRILLKDQTNQTDNGIYTVAATGAPARATDADSSAELTAATVMVEQGTVNADKAFTQTTNSPVLGTSNLVWAQIGGGSSYSAGAGLSLSTGVFAVVPGAGILADGTSTRVDPNYPGLIKRYAADVGTTGTTVTMTHNLATADHLTQVSLKATGEVVECDILLGLNADSLTFATAPTAGLYRYVAIA